MMEFLHILRLIVLTAGVFALIGIWNVMMSGESQQVTLRIDGWKD